MRRARHLRSIHPSGPLCRCSSLVFFFPPHSLRLLLSLFMHSTDGSHLDAAQKRTAPRRSSKLGFHFGFVYCPPYPHLNAHGAKQKCPRFCTVSRTVHPGPRAGSCLPSSTNSFSAQKKKKKLTRSIYVHMDGAGGYHVGLYSCGAHACT